MLKPQKMNLRVVIHADDRAAATAVRRALGDDMRLQVSPRNSRNAKSGTTEVRAQITMTASTRAAAGNDVRGVVHKAMKAFNHDYEIVSP